MSNRKLSKLKLFEPKKRLTVPSLRKSTTALFNNAKAPKRKLQAVSSL